MDQVTMIFRTAYIELSGNLVPHGSKNSTQKYLL
jgi:hypothetical protein